MPRTADLATTRRPGHGHPGGSGVGTTSRCAAGCLRCSADGQRWVRRTVPGPASFIAGGVASRMCGRAAGWPGQRVRRWRYPRPPRSADGPGPGRPATAGAARTQSVRGGRRRRGVLGVASLADLMSRPVDRWIDRRSGRSPASRRASSSRRRAPLATWLDDRGRARGGGGRLVRGVDRCRGAGCIANWSERLVAPPRRPAGTVNAHREPQTISLGSSANGLCRTDLEAITRPGVRYCSPMTKGCSSPIWRSR